MKTKIERREASSFSDYLSLTVATCGVGYSPIAPGTCGSVVGVAIYLCVEWAVAAFAVSEFGHGGRITEPFYAYVHAVICILLFAYSLFGIWAAGRSTVLLGNSDASQIVVDEVMGQLVTFLFIPFTFSWKMILAGFLLFRLFDIWKPFPIDDLQALPSGIGVCADDIIAGVYAGIVLVVIYALGFLL
ncbi:MAG: phosphatidylglycerophosphatase A family protein [Pyrinomonadaceae bacterium]